MSKKAFGLLCLFLAPVMQLAAQEAPATPVDQGLTQTLVMVGIAIAFFYFILWRPEQKRRKALEQQQGAMKKGDQVVCMGLVGSVVKIKEHTVVVRSATSEVEFLKAAISEVKPGSGSSDEDKSSS